MMEKTSVPYDTMSVNSVGTEPMFSRCCCCIPLRIGCFILGYISLLLTSIRTLFFVGITLFYGYKTNGFNHISPSADDDEDDALDKEFMAMDQETMAIVGWFLVVVTVCELVWLSINIACLVGIHKKRPGPIRVYVGLATFRLILTISAYMYQPNTIDGGVIAHCIHIALTAYFILVYYIYAMRLTKEAMVLPQVQPKINDNIYIYPTKLDKEHLVV